MLGILCWAVYKYFANEKIKAIEIQTENAKTQVFVQASKGEETYKKSVGEASQSEPTEKTAHASRPHPFFKLKKQNEVGLARYTSAKERLKNVSVSGAVKINERPYFIVSARAFLTSENNSNINPSIYNLAGFSIVKLETQAPTDLILDVESKPVVLNSKNLSFGIVTGTLIVKLKEFEAAESLGLEIVYSDADTATVYLKAPVGISLLSLISSLKKNSSVLNVEIEIIENTKVAK